jgi:hypothetical protein
MRPLSTRGLRKIRVLSLTDNILIGIAILGGALLLMVLINRLWPARVRYEKEDLIGWQLNILATTHAVILGFMLYSEWTDFTAAQQNVETEASALRDLFRLAEGLPAEARAAVEKQSREYAAAVIEDDWPQLARGQTPEVSHDVNKSLWRTLSSVHEGTATQIVALDHALTELETLTEHRRARLLQAKRPLPGIFWAVLIVGGTLTIASVAMFGSRHSRVHLFQVLSLTLLVTLAILAIADLDRPFQGWVHVDDYPFRRALENMP